MLKMVNIIMSQIN